MGFTLVDGMKIESGRAKEMVTGENRTRIESHTYSDCCTYVFN